MYNEKENKLIESRSIYLKINNFFPRATTLSNQEFSIILGIIDFMNFIMLISILNLSRKNILFIEILMKDLKLLKNFI